ncbi:MAG: alpha/beta hydrolase, partial [Planctomycetota bacterium]
MRTLLLLLSCWYAATAALTSDIPYADCPGHDPAFTSLDIHAPDAANALPVVIYVHGGGWWQGDKRAVHQKADFFNAAGWLFVSVNYRLTPDVPFPTHAQDVARAVAWVRSHIAAYGGDPQRLVLFGHSAGAHLAALVATDPRYLEEQGLELAAIEAAIINDSAGYDMVDRAARAGGQLYSIYAATFTQDPDMWHAGSPALRIDPHRPPPPMVVLYSRGDDPDAINPLREDIARDFAHRLNRIGVMAELIDGSAFTHGEINRLFGDPGNTLGDQTLDFLGRVSGFTRLRWQRDLPVGQVDADDQIMAGTETLFLTGHAGMLFAGTGSWNEDSAPDGGSGARILFKEAADAPWRVEHVFPDHVRVGCLQTVTLTTTAEGTALAEPRTMLLASPQGITGQATVWVRDDASASWIEMILHESLDEPAQNFARAITDHIDAVTGVHAVHAGVATAAVYRAVLDPAAAGGLRWDALPELTGSERCHALCVANGRLYASIGSTNDPADGDGGLYRRIDGPDPSWEFLWEWTVPPGKHPGLRGLTAVPDPDGGAHEVLLGGLEGDGTIIRLDPVTPPMLTVEYAFGDHFRGIWGGLGGAATLAAYNRMYPAVDPRTGRPVHLIGLFVNHPEVGGGFPMDGAWFLIRQQDGGYGWGGIADPADVRPDPLRAVRSFQQAPWTGSELHAGGF